LRSASNNIAQASSLTQVADGGAQQIQNALIQLQSLAQQANSPILNSANRADLNQQFNQILASVNQLAQSTSFNGQNLLDGSLNGNSSLSLDALLGTANAGGALSISDLTSGGLLAGIGNLLSADSAGQSLSALSDALNQVISTRADIGSFQQTLNFASANIDSAINNQEAAQSQLSETDIAAASTRKAQDEVQLNAAIALVAQTNNLSPALLKLVG
jgi:flagellin